MPAAAEQNIDSWYYHGHIQVLSSLAAHLAVHPFPLLGSTKPSGLPNGKL